MMIVIQLYESQFKHEAANSWSYLKRSESLKDWDIERLVLWESIWGLQKE